MDNNIINNPIPKKRGRKPKEKKLEEIKKIPKKRGRKPKIKNNENKEPKIPKKRGRKPKEKKPEEIKKIPKKRGRKPKEKIYSVLNINKNLNDLDSNIVIHIPLKEEDIKDSSIYENNLFEYKPNIYDPKPYEESVMEIKYLNDNNNLNNSKYALYKSDEINLKDKTIDNNLEEEKKILNNKNIDKTINFNTIKKENYNENNNEISNEINNEINNSNTIQKKNNNEINYNNLISSKYLKNINNLMIWPNKTNQLCLWCCHSIDHKPIPLPFKKIDKIFHVRGYFCTYNCAASYNFEKNDNEKWKRYSLLCYLCKISNKTNFKKINLAPPRESLQIFGGNLLIEEFRKKSINNKKINLLYPPLITIIPHIEEYQINKNQEEKKYIPINGNLMNKAINSLKLKRKKPITNNKTLKSYMSLQIK